MTYLGIDWSRKTSTFDASDASGKRLRKGTADNSDECFRALVRELKDAEGIRVLIEVGPRVFRWARAMQEEGADVFVLETHQNALIRESTRKTDARDAFQLREQRRLQMLPPDRVPIPGIREEELRALVTARAKLIKERTSISNQVTRYADYYGYYIGRGACTSESGWKKLLGESIQWSVTHQLFIKQLYERFAVVAKQLEEIEHELEQRAAEPESEKKAALLRTIPGIGPVTTWALLARIGEIHRFPSARKAVRYAGLAPSQRQSGNFHGGGRLTKSGNALLRSYLTQAAIGVITSKDVTNPLRLWYEQVKKRRGWKKARVALARKILTVAYGVLKHGRPFDPSLLAPREKQAA